LGGRSAKNTILRELATGGRKDRFCNIERGTFVSKGGGVTLHKLLRTSGGKFQPFQGRGKRKLGAKLMERNWAKHD